ncbi:MAG: hypothetical protein ACAI25_03670 [Planctomycetota bacterium]
MPIDPVPEGVPEPLVALAQRIDRPDVRVWWYIPKCRTHDSSYELVARRGRMCVTAITMIGHFNLYDVERDYDRLHASTLDEAANVALEVLDRPPRHMSETPPHAPPEFLELVAETRRLAPRAVILWERTAAALDDPWRNVIVVEPPEDERGGGQATCHFSPEKKQWGTGGAPHITQAYWSATPRNAAAAIVMYLWPGRPPSR